MVELVAVRRDRRGNVHALVNRNGRDRYYINVSMSSAWRMEKALWPLVAAGRGRFDTWTTECLGWCYRGT